MGRMQEHKYSIKNWAKDDRPREKLLSTGAENLSNSELIAILLQKGSREKTAVDLARDILRLTSNSLEGLARITVPELMRVKGVGAVKAISVVAAMELGRRRQVEQLAPATHIASGAEAARFLQARFADYRHEVFGVIYLNSANRVQQIEIISEGGMTSTVADPRIILRRALEEDAVNLILFHNHPSGSLRPSRADEQLTRKIRDAASLFDIRMLDHVIVSRLGFFSFADEDLL